MTPVIDVRHLNLQHEGEPIVEFEPTNGEGHHVVTHWRGMDCFKNYWSIDDMEPGVREVLENAVHCKPFLPIEPHTPAWCGVADVPPVLPQPGPKANMTAVTRTLGPC